MRTLPVLLDFAHGMEELCPNAWLLNFSNPEMRIVLGVNKYTKIRCIGLCHGVFMARDDMARMMGRDRLSIEVYAAGMNHFQWVLSVRDKETGEQAIKVVTSIFFNERRHIPSAIVYNDGAISQLPDDIAVEIPVMVDGDGVHKQVVRDMPAGIIGLLNQQVSAQRLSVLAAAEGSAEIALQALLCDPTINSTKAAVGIRDELFEINRPYIRKCK